MVSDITFSSRFFKVGKILDVFILPIVNFVTPGKINKKNRELRVPRLILL